MKTMTLPVLISMVLSSALLPVTSYADAHNALRGDVSKTMTRTTPNGTLTRTLQQQRTDTGLIRQQTLTTPDGRTAQRDTTIINDRENQTRTKEVSGTRLNGDSYSGVKTTTRTDTGFEQAASRTNAQGQTATSNKTVTIDKDAGLATSVRTVTDFNGETHTISKTIERGSGAAAQ